MTKRNPDIESNPMVCSFVADYQAFQDFKSMVGDQNVSRELRAMIKDRVAQEKNEKAHEERTIIDPLGLSNLTQSGKASRLRDGDHYRQSTLFETFAVRDRRNEINNFIQSVEDTVTLNQIEQNCKAMLLVSGTRRKRLVFQRV